MSATPLPPIVLASTSPYRAQLLQRILPGFLVEAPDVDESALPGESPDALARRLAESKALAVAKRHRSALVIGSDQVAAVDGQVLGKPHQPARARGQLEACSGRAVEFHTGLCLVDTRVPGAMIRTEVDLTRVHFRALSGDEIARYVERDEPLDCAGSFRVERLGVALFERIDGSDPTALIGLPLIRVCRMLRAAGVPVP